jgi:hypothetical protein
MAILALSSGGFDAIASDWRVAQLALQVIAEQGPGMAYAAAESWEDAQVAALARGMRGRRG